MEASTFRLKGKQRAFTLIFSLAAATVATAQLDVQNGLTVESYVNDVLLGDGVTAFNITYSGGMQQLGQMVDGASSDFAFNEGLVMSTSHAKGIGCSAAVCGDCLGMATTDSSLLMLANEVPAIIGESFSVNQLADVSVLEFDFISSGDSIGFDYIFGSDEYLTWVNSQYNDVFGFFLSGPGIEGPYTSPAAFPGGAVNIAGVPGSDPNLPITVSSVNNVLNSEYFVFNLPPDGICINGYTSVFHAGYPVQCGETYHLKLAIADGTDSGVESVVILEQGSFTSEVPIVVTENFEVGGEGTDQIFEGCGTLSWTFERPADVPLDVPYQVQVDFNAGEAENGTDFAQLLSDGTTQPFGDTLSFEPGEASLDLTLVALTDAIDEGSENLVVIFTSVESCADGLMYLTYTIEDGPDPIVIEPINSLICGGLQVLVEPEVTGGFGNYTYAWSCSNSTNSSIAVLVEENWSCELMVSDTCGLDTAIALNTIQLLDSIPLTLDLLPDSSAILEGDSVTAMVQIDGGYNPNGFSVTSWFLNDTLAANTLDTFYTFYPNFYDILIATTTDGCNTTVSDTLVIEPLYAVDAVITVVDSSATGPDSLAFYGCESNALQFSPSASTSTSDEVLYYAWDWGDGELEYTMADTVSHQWNDPGVYEVRLYMADPYESFDISEPFVVTVYPQPQLTLWADSPVCIGGMGQAEVTVNPAELTQTAYYSGGDAHLSDSIAQTYSFPLSISGFSDTASLTECSDLLKIRANLEHAHVGALDLWVTCPDGSALSLMQNNPDSLDSCNGGADLDDAYLGEPIVELGNDTAGIGAQYTWSAFGVAVLDDASNTLFNGTSIGAGTYAACDDWCALEGCPINGEWTLHVATEDSLGDGHFFGWNLQFSHPELDSLGLGNPGLLNPDLSGFNWGAFAETATITEDTLSFAATYETSEIGNYLVSFTGVDQFGCSTTRYKAIQVNDGLGFSVQGGSNPNACADIRPLTATLVNNSYTNCPGMPYSNSWCVGNNVDTVFTVCPMIQGDGTQMHLMFDAAQLDSIADVVIVHDGPDTSYPVLGTYSGDLSNMEWGSTDGTGCLSFHVITNDSLSCADGAFGPMSFTIDCNPFFLDVVWSWEPGIYVVDSTAQNTQALPDSPVTEYVVKAYYEGQESCFSSDTLKVVTQLSAEWLAFQPDCDVSNGTLVMDIDAPGVQNPQWTVNLVIQDSTALAYTDTVGNSPFAFTFLPVGVYAVDISNDNCSIGEEIALDVAEDGLPCGCTYAIFDNYDPEAVLDDGSCGFEDYVCEADTDGDGVCDEFEVLGCTDPEACNYHPGATEENGSCWYPEPGTDCPGPDYSDWCAENYENPCPEDLTGDGAITIADLLQVISQYGQDCD